MSGIFMNRVDERHVRFARKMIIASLVALLVGVAVVVYAGLRR